MARRTASRVEAQQSAIPGESMDTDYDKGYRQFTQMVGSEHMDELVERFRRVCPDFEREVITVIGGRTWTRGVIDLKTRSLCTIGILAALGRVNALKLNYRMALKNGARPEEIFEALFQVAVYAGFAAAWDALEMLAEVLDEQD
jgi:4-carboxymuconolactone decarboxylase